MSASTPAGPLAAADACAAARPRSVPAGDRAFLAVCALAFVASAAGTIAWCGSMSGGMPMPGGWTMSMAWMRMAGQTWPGAAASFTAMWALMMTAMMLPSLVPMLSGHRRALAGAGVAALGGPTAAAAAGYLLLWAAVGALAYPIGAALAAAEMRWDSLARAVPAATAAVLVAAGLLQLTPWKARRLAACRDAGSCGGPAPAGLLGSFRHGVRLGVHCASCCAGFVAALLVGGVMDVGVMGLLTVAITAERYALRPALVARGAGLALVAVGLVRLLG